MPARKAPVHSRTWKGKTKASQVARLLQRQKGATRDMIHRVTGFPVTRGYLETVAGPRGLKIKEIGDGRWSAA